MAHDDSAPQLGRRQFTLALAAALASPAMSALTASAADAPSTGGKTRPPNIVYIVSDDQGWKDVGFHGSDIQTPNIDALARGGAQLDHFYTQPMCTPTRAAFMTGRYPFRYGLQTAVILSNHTYGLATDEWLLPQALKQAGYTTAIVGKWHLGHGDRKYWPRQRGFDYQYGPLIGEIDYFTHSSHEVRDWFRNNEPVEEKGYSTTLLGDDAVRLIGAHDASSPLFLYLAFNAPHSPYQAPQEYVDRYKNIEDPTRRTYAGMISALDDQIGRVVAALEKKGIRDNTLIVFHSDNGGTKNKMFAGEGDLSKITIPVDNGPLRDGKASLYEGGTRVAALANWPGHIAAGSTVEGMMHVVDMYPTLAGLAGAKLGANKPLDGIDVWKTISTGAPSPRTEIVYNIEPFRAGIREGDWKLIWRTPLPAALELYDIGKDPFEKQNVAAAHPEIVAKLQQRANVLASEMQKPLLLETEFKAVLERMKLPPAFPGEDALFDAAD
jgi:arylsulfatase A-like enzyme